MDLITSVPILPYEFKIDHSTRISLLGSCFSENIGYLMLNNKFVTDVNPFGILYNPYSISSAIKRMLSKEDYKKEDLVYHNGLYHSFMHHGSFSDPDPDICLNNISSRFTAASEFINGANILFITFGTAYVYRLHNEGSVVGNCHKFPANAFKRSRLSVEEIVNESVTVIEELHKVNPTMKIIFTVSPIRHLRDGAHENQLSKAVLHISIDQLQKIYPQKVFYFPAYEIMMDELRDYRYYADDMNHPSALAIQYIWERFCDSFYTPATKKILFEWQSILKSLNHKSINPSSQEHKQFQKQVLKKLLSFKDKYPIVDCNNEIANLKRTI